VLFTSTASNLVPEDTNNAPDVCLRLVQASLSPDGNLIAFETAASNLVSGDTNKVADIYLRDLLLKTMVRASVNATGKQNMVASRYQSMINEGVSFQTSGALAAGVPSGITQVYFRTYGVQR
jgi:hypothetical protein